MTDTHIPDDVMKLAREAAEAGNTDPEWFLAGTREKHIARTIIADREAQAERIRKLEEALRRLLKCEYDGQGLTDCIDNDGCHYPSQELADAIANAEAEFARALLAKEGSDA